VLLVTSETIDCQELSEVARDILSVNGLASSLPNNCTVALYTPPETRFDPMLAMLACWVLLLLQLSRACYCGILRHSPTPLDWCRSAVVRAIPNLQRQEWSRSRKDFDQNVVPWAVIAGLGLLVGIIVWIVHVCQKSDKEEVILQR
jgi:hypothetical protein